MSLIESIEKRIIPKFLEKTFKADSFEDYMNYTGTKKGSNVEVKLSIEDGDIDGLPYKDFVMNFTSRTTNGNKIVYNESCGWMDKDLFPFDFEKLKFYLLKGIITADYRGHEIEEKFPHLSGNIRIMGWNGKIMSKENLEEMKSIATQSKIHPLRKPKIQNK